MAAKTAPVELDIPITVEGTIDDAFIQTLAQLLVDLSKEEEEAGE